MINVDNGFLIVASQAEHYVEGAEFAGGSIKDYYPDAHVTLVLPKRMYRKSLHNTFDHIIYEDVPDHIRTKLWALSRTPYKNLTAYIDADMECRHEDVCTIWDQIAPETDVLITKIRPYNGKIARWKNGEMIYHGGFFLYRNNPHTMEFMKRWWEDYVKQRSEPWPYVEEECPVALRPWDQFTFWKLINKDNLRLKVDIFPDDARWNFVNGYYLTETNNPIIFYHHTIPDVREWEVVKKKGK